MYNKDLGGIFAVTQFCFYYCCLVLNRFLSLLLGIADSRGVACDFQGPYCVGDQGYMAFGAPTRALKMSVSKLRGGKTSIVNSARHWHLLVRPLVYYNIQVCYFLCGENDDAN